MLELNGLWILVSYNMNFEIIEYTNSTYLPSKNYHFYSILFSICLNERLFYRELFNYIGIFNSEKIKEFYIIIKNMKYIKNEF